jgi:hypothetical protein
MTSFADYVKNTRHVEIPKGTISGAWFQENRIPMVVRCTCCEMTMASPSAWIDDEGYTYCSECAGVSDD